jgi:hypothetical protein
METVCFSETLLSTYDCTRRHNPEQKHHHVLCLCQIVSFFPHMSLDKWSSTSLSPAFFRYSWEMLSLDHELIPARNSSIAAMQGSASGNNVRYYSTWKHSPLKERN